MATKQYLSLKRRLKRKSKDYDILLTAYNKMTKMTILDKIFAALLFALAPLGLIYFSFEIIPTLYSYCFNEDNSPPVTSSLVPREGQTWHIAPSGWSTIPNNEGWKIIPDNKEAPADKETSQPKILFAKGNCIDKALNILTIIKRDNKLDDTIYIALGGTSTIGYHVQCVKIEKDGSKHYLDLNGNYNVIYNASEFGYFLPDEYLYLKPAVFIAAAMKYTPDISYIELRDFLLEIERDEKYNYLLNERR